MISEERVEKAIEYFRNNKERYGALVGRCRAIEHERKVILDEEKLKIFKANPEMRVSEVESRARTSTAYMAILEELENVWAGRMLYGVYKVSHL
jgi:hypothetical protein